MLFIILFFIKINAYCQMDECQYYCKTKHQPQGYTNEIWFGVCEPINSPPEKRRCKCGYKLFNGKS